LTTRADPNLCSIGNMALVTASLPKRLVSKTRRTSMLSALNVATTASRSVAFRAPSSTQVPAQRQM